MSDPKFSDSSQKPFVFSWRRLLLHCSILSIGVLLGLLSWFISKPHSVRFHETKAEEYLAISVTPDIEIAMDSNSSIAITENNPLRMELFKGNIYFDVKKNAHERPEIKVGDTLIEDVGYRFSIRLHKDGSNTISVAEGLVKVHVASGTHLISTLEQADFDGFSISKHRMISEREVAPWHSQRRKLQ